MGLWFDPIWLDIPREENRQLVIDGVIHGICMSWREFAHARKTITTIWTVTEINKEILQLYNACRIRKGKEYFPVSGRVIENYPEVITAILRPWEYKKSVRG